MIARYVAKTPILNLPIPNLTAQCARSECHPTVINIHPSLGVSYDFSGWVNIPRTNDRFRFTLEVNWLNRRNRVIGTSTIANYTAATTGWSQTNAALIAPPDATSAQLRMVVDNLKATLYIDDIALK